MFHNNTKFFVLSQRKKINNQINQILISQTTYTKPVGLVEVAHAATATVEVQAPAKGTAELRTAPVDALGAPTAQQTIRVVKGPSGMQF